MAFALLVGSSAPTHAQAAPQAVSLAVDSGSHTWLLWNNPDGSAALWNLDAAGSLVAKYAYGPYTDGAPQNTWSATAVSVGPGGAVHLLWNNTDRRAMLWNVSAADGTFTLAGYGPYTDNAPQNLWNVTALATGPDGLSHLLWGNTDHRAMLWSVDGSFNFTLAGYGPYTDNYVNNDPGNWWDAVSVSAVSGGVTRLLWRNVDHRAMLWNVDSAFNILSVVGYGPYTDGAPQNIWDALAVVTGPDNVSHLLWKNTDGRAMFWNVHADATFDVFGYGPYTGLAVDALAVGPDGKGRILWNGPNGSAQIWTINPSGDYNPVIYSAVASLNLTAAATGSNKITLYWNGVAGASSYNVYRGTLSGGPYSLVASNVSNPNIGPGRANGFMYTDGNGLATGTEYFYVVTAVLSSVEVAQSNENSATPDASAIPWDSGDPAQIVAAVNATAVNDLKPDIDGNGKVIPQQVGVLFIGGPNGVVYLGNMPNGIPPAAYPPPGYVVGHALVGNDGSVVVTPDDDLGVLSTDSAPRASEFTLPLWSVNLLNPLVFTSDTYPYQSTRPPTGIYRKVESVPGFSGMDGTVGLPDVSFTQIVNLLNHPSTIDPKPGYPRQNFPTVGEVYSGGTVISPNGTEGSEIDAGLQLVPHLDSTTLDWSPIVYNHDRFFHPNNNVLHPDTGDKIYLDGSVDALPIGNQPGAKMYKMRLRGTLNMQFLTPKFASVRDQSVRLHYSVTPQINGLPADYGYIDVTAWNSHDNEYESIAEPQYLTLEFFQATGWHKATGQFVIKRVNALAQDLNGPGMPQANAPAASTTKGYFADGSYLHPPPPNISANDAFWRSVQLYDPTKQWLQWGADSTMTRRAGAYPTRTLGGAVSYIFSPYYEEHLSMTAQ